MVTFYKIRNKTNHNLFSKGGMWYEWTDESASKKKGKVWAQPGHAKAHISMIRRNLEYFLHRVDQSFAGHHLDSPYHKRVTEYLANAEIVEYAFTTSAPTEKVIPW